VDQPDHSTMITSAVDMAHTITNAPMIFHRVVEMPSIRQS
jgi:hypothetical protein